MHAPALLAHALLPLTLLPLALLPLALSACAPPAPAPTEIDGLTRYFLDHYEDEDPEALLRGVDALDTLASDLLGEGELGGELSDLDRSAFDALGLPAEADPAAPVGIFHLTPQACTLDDVVAIFLHPQQDRLFEGSYVRYERRYRDDPACFQAGDCGEALWDVDILSELVLGIEAEYALVSGVRWASSAEGARPPVLLSRTHMPAPAAVEGAAYFDQSVQIEVLLPWQGEVLHLYGLWNAGGVEGLDPDAPFWKDRYLQGLRDYNARIDALCATRADWDG